MLGKLRDKLDGAYISNHFIMVEVSTEMIEWNANDEQCNDPLNLKGIFYKSGREKSDNDKLVTDLISSKPLKFSEGKYYYYLLYDLWYVTPESILQISILKESGVHKIEVKVHVDKIKDFNVNCVNPDSDKFLSK